MAEIIITETNYCDKAYGAWMGKCIGGTLGRPVEGRRGPHRLTFYHPVPRKAAENDDVDVQLVWLHALRERGIDISSRELASEWLDHIIYWFDEYRFARSNFKKGLAPPISGWFNNWFKDSMRSSIRSEIWAMIAPGSPKTAAEYAYRDAIIDHTEEGVYGEMFLAAVQSAAFVMSDVKKLLKIGLAAIPPECRVSKAVQDVIRWRRKKSSWAETRQMLLKEHGSENFADTPQNIGIITLGWLHGEGDFETGILSAVNCGLDAGSNAGSLGAILGIISGLEGIPSNWQAPIQGRITPGRGIVGFDPPTEMELLAEQSLLLARTVAEKKNTGIRIPPDKPKGRRRATPADFGSDVSPIVISKEDWLAEEHHIGPAVLRIQYPGYPSISYDKPTEIDLSLLNTSDKGIEGRIDFVAPWGWQLEPQEGVTFTIRKKGKPCSVKLALRVHENDVQLLPVNPVSARITFKGQQPLDVNFSLLGERRLLIAGPYGKKGDRAFNREYLPEKALSESEHDGKVLFKKASFPEFSMDVNPFFGTKKEGVVYAFGWFFASRKRDLRLFVSCNDGIKVWLNDRLALAKHDHSPIRPPMYRADVQVHRGWNRLLLKVARCGKPVDLHLYFGDRKNHVFDDLIDTYLPSEVVSLTS